MSVFGCCGRSFAMVLLILVSCILIVTCQATTNSFDELIRKTVYGNVQGYQTELPTGQKINHWLGIPFASPPIDDLRWKGPIPPQSWSELRNTTELPPPCVQSDGSGEEDCLYLNVHMLANPTDNGPYPVLYYIYGGGLIFGSTGWYWDAFVGRAGQGNGLIVVEIQYRVNLFGFLATKELSQEQAGYSGNYGFQDQILGLHWVQENIHYFNGDKNCVTISGQSSGGTSVFALLSSPAASGLFHRAFSLSGSPNMTISLTDAEIQNTGIVTDSGCQDVDYTKTLACMRQLNSTTVASLMPGSWYTPTIFGMPVSPQGNHWAGVPVVDGKTVAKPFYQAYAEGINDVPFMFGSMGQESNLGPYNDVTEYTIPQWKEFLETSYSAWDGTGKVGDEIAALYADDAAANPQKAYDSIVSDYGLACGNIIITQTKPLQRKSSTYLYVNQWNLIKSAGDPGAFQQEYAFHLLDLFMVTEDYRDLLHDNKTYIPEERDLMGSRILQTIWYDFMKTGVPKADWKPVNDVEGWEEGNYNTYLIDYDGKMGNKVNYRKEECDYYSTIGMTAPGFWWSN